MKRHFQKPEDKMQLQLFDLKTGSNVQQRNCLALWEKGLTLALCLLLRRLQLSEAQQSA